MVLGRSFRESQGRQPDSGNPTVRDDTGGLGKRGLWGKDEPTVQTERVRVGNSPPKERRAPDLSRLNLNQALVWNVGTYCMMRRENPISGGPTKGESIDAYSRGGPSRSSDEVLVMRMERRGWASLRRAACQPR
jgi:hypothetical protein